MCSSLSGWLLFFFFFSPFFPSPRLFFYWLTITWPERWRQFWALRAPILVIFNSFPHKEISNFLFLRFVIFLFSWEENEEEEEKERTRRREEWTWILLIFFFHFLILFSLPSLSLSRSLMSASVSRAKRRPRFPNVTKWASFYISATNPLTMVT